MEYPSNSINKKPGPAPEAPRPEPVVTGTVIVRKPSIGKRLKEVFVGGDANTVWSYVALDILVPAIQDTFVDAVIGGVERAIYGGSRTTSAARRGRGASSSGATGRIDYGAFSKQGNTYVQNQGRQLSQTSRATLNFDELVLPTRTEAESVIEHLGMLIDQYQVATVRDLYDLCKVTNADYTANKWGWTDIRDAGIDRLSRGQGYVLNLPRPEELRD